MNEKSCKQLLNCKLLFKNKLNRKVTFVISNRDVAFKSIYVMAAQNFTIKLVNSKKLNLSM